MIAAVIASLETFPDYTYAFQTPVGITFNASLNTTKAIQNQGIRATFSDSNYFLFPNEPSNMNIFRATNLSMVGPCHSFESPFAAGVFQGTFNTQNISSAKRLPIWDEFSVWSCPAQPVGSVSRLTPFQAFTDKIDFNGYWTDGITNHPGGGYSEGIIHPFVPGIYTLLVADAWGHTEFLYFWVKAA
ncbi:MAG TPA: hypothetical protein VGR56_05335 [Nitrososphaerales archaeon]|nr:hypothetical protein [Nitrososphaerales archaeon]